VNLRALSFSTIASGATLTLLLSSPAGAQFSPPPAAGPPPTPAAPCLTSSVLSNVPASDDDRTSVAFSGVPGDTFPLRLSTNPSTGYSWSIGQQPDAKVVCLLQTSMVKAAVALTGAPQSQVWTFRAVSPGTTTLTLIYARPFDHGAAPAKTVTLTFTVAPGPAPTASPGKP
jgi:inhibitor of cysteine peptidase